MAFLLEVAVIPNLRLLTDSEMKWHVEIEWKLKIAVLAAYTDWHAWFGIMFNESRLQCTLTAISFEDACWNSCEASPLEITVRK